MTAKTPKRKRSAWFAFYPDDYIGGTRNMTLAARGAFIELLAHQFAYGSVPSDPTAICRIIGAFPKEWKAISDQVLSKFRVTESGDLINDRMDAERLEREEIRGKRVAAVSKRWNKSNTSVLQEYPVCSDFVSTTTTTTTTLPTNVGSYGQLYDYQALSLEGRYVDALAARIGVSREGLDKLVEPIQSDCLVAYSTAKAADGWVTRGGKSIDPLNWKADFDRYWSHYHDSKIKDGSLKPIEAKKPQGPPANWREIGNRVLDRSMDGLEYSDLKHGEKLAIADAIRNA